MNGAGPCKVSTKPAAPTAATSVEKSGLALATATMSPASAPSAAMVVSAAAVVVLASLSSLHATNNIDAAMAAAATERFFICVSS